MTRRKKRNGAFKVVVPVQKNPANLREVSVTIPVARDAAQAEVMANMSITLLGFSASKAKKVRTTPLGSSGNPKDSEHTRGD